ncbi:phosphoribosylglycinamide formyltransferase [Aureimonas endophytica]|uniref:Phosphoribosylglycinamide formyltransferase n=1 Tax=Aureimonas endophytica TaxID=2027858 RepID=A0A916ZC46_9HYPH|nr:phosphoribosylglycinamide formyltransferase [Aureimonas endophytica]GGD85869.1 phosphoribosylglycinamide formyltransferase [Aureimonas endophytica]
MSGPRKRVAVLISGRGSNMMALVEAARQPDFPGEIVAVLADKPEAAGLAFAAEAGIEGRAFPRRDYGSKAEHEAAFVAAIEAARADIVCLAGFMRLLSADFVERYRGRLINIHPSLLPKFPGLDTHGRAIAAGESEHGCTVHFVTAEMDAGPAIAQARVPVLPGDTPDSLAARVLKEEHRLYPQALATVLRGEARFESA